MEILVHDVVSVEVLAAKELEECQCWTRQLVIRTRRAGALRTRTLALTLFSDQPNQTIPGEQAATEIPF